MSWIDAIGADDVNMACAMQDVSFTYQVVLQSMAGVSGTSCRGLVDATSALEKRFSIDFSHPTVSLLLDGGSVMMYAVSFPDQNQLQPEAYMLSYAGGRWSLVKEGDVPIDPGPWLKNWCSVRKGQTRTQAIALMGQPRGEWSANTGPSQPLVWQQGHYSFTALRNNAGIVTSFHTNYNELTLAEKAKVSCPQIHGQDG